jgi:hypothetical protein
MEHWTRGRISGSYSYSFNVADLVLFPSIEIFCARLCGRPFCEGRRPSVFELVGQTDTGGIGTASAAGGGGGAGFELRFAASRGGVGIGSDHN